MNVCVRIVGWRLAEPGLLVLCPVAGPGQLVHGANHGRIRDLEGWGILTVARVIAGKVDFQILGEGVLPGPREWDLNGQCTVRLHGTQNQDGSHTAIIAMQHHGDPILGTIPFNFVVNHDRGPAKPILP